MMSSPNARNACCISRIFTLRQEFSSIRAGIRRLREAGMPRRVMTRRCYLRKLSKPRHIPASFLFKGELRRGESIGSSSAGAERRRLGLGAMWSMSSHARMPKARRNRALFTGWAATLLHFPSACCLVMNTFVCMPDRPIPRTSRISQSATTLTVPRESSMAGCATGRLRTWRDRYRPSWNGLNCDSDLGLVFKRKDADRGHGVSRSEEVSLKRVLPLAASRTQAVLRRMSARNGVGFAKPQAAEVNRRHASTFHNLSSAGYL